MLRNPNAPRYADDPRTIGEHIRKRRIERGLSQRDLSAALAVTEDCITGWENGRSQPQVQYYPRIIGFLGYYPLAHKTETISGKLTQIRHCNGLSFRRCAALLQVSEDAAKRWERGSPVAHASTRELIEHIWQRLPNRHPKHPV